MNSAKDLNQRLLSLFPVALLKEFFSPEARYLKEVIEEVTSKNTTAGILKFVTANVGHTKQYIHFFTLSKRWDPETTLRLPFTELEVFNDRTSYVFTGLLKVTISGIVTGAVPENISMQMMQPVRISIKGKQLILQVTKLEKKLDHYYDVEDARIVNVQKDWDEERILEAVGIAFVKAGYEVQSTDLNPGIKAIWELGTYDATRSEYKLSNSTHTQIMDEGKFIKSDTPAEYEKIKQTPLQRNLFKLRTPNGTELCPNFLAEATKGCIRINSYPTESNQVQNVIEQILSNNK